MKRVLLLLTVLTACQTTALAQKQKDFTLSSSIFNQSIGKLFLVYWKKTNKVVDSAEIKNGKFMLSRFLSQTGILYQKLLLYNSLIYHLLYPSA